MDVLQSRNYVFRLPETGLFCSANRYFPQVVPPGGQTFVFFHNAASHKEVWEPIIARIFQLAENDGTRNNLRIREAWSLDWQNHGDSAVLNQTHLNQRDFFPVREVGDLVKYFLESDFVAGHSIVVVAHSASASACVLGMNRLKHIPVKAAVFIEPALNTPTNGSRVPTEKEIHRFLLRFELVLVRRDTWDSKESLTRWLRKQSPWKMWDQQILDLYIKHGFVETTKGGRQVITPKTTNRQEVSSYMFQDHTEALDHFAEFCSRVPVHVIFGERSEVTFYENRKVICDASLGRTVASQTIAPNVGHWAVQEKPVLIADIIIDALQRPSTARL